MNLIWGSTGPDQRDNLPTSQQPCYTVPESLVRHRSQRSELDRFSSQ